MVFRVFKSSNEGLLSTESHISQTFPWSSKLEEDTPKGLNASMVMLYLGVGTLVCRYGCGMRTLSSCEKEKTNASIHKTNASLLCRNYPSSCCLALINSQSGKYLVVSRSVVV